MFRALWDALPFKIRFQIHAMWNPELALKHMLLKITAADK
jgi:hypothetical protein